MTIYLIQLLAAGEPAGGAPMQDLVPAALVGGVLTAAALVLGAGHRSGRLTLLTRLAGLTSRVMPVPGWSSLPVLLTLVSLGIAAFGFFWDVATHIDDGRDDGPFANVAHYPILLGLGGVALAGFLACVLGADDRDRAALTVAPGWRVPLGGALLLLCGSVAMLGFPLDDVWHRLFGQDVTLWGPTHVLMIGGASLAPIAAWLLLVEGRRAAGKPGASRLVELEETAPGTYRTAEPVPVHGDWKTMVRLHSGNSILAMPVYLPEDPVIPARKVPAQPRYERALQLDSEILRREERGGAAWLSGVAYGILGVVALAWLAAIVAAVTRFERLAPRLAAG